MHRHHLVSKCNVRNLLNVYFIDKYSWLRYSLYDQNLKKEKFTIIIVNGQINQQKNKYQYFSEDIVYKNQMTTISEIHGINVSHLAVVQLDKSAFSSVDFQLFPPQREHFLIHAIQFQKKLPTEASMLRSERRNERKSGQSEANKVLGRATRIIVNPKRQRRERYSFVVPAKQLPKMDPKLKKKMRGRRMRGPVTALSTTRKVKMAVRPKRTAFKVVSPQKVVLKCARTACKQQMQKWRQEVPPTIAEVVDTTPLYFKKKKANQKRRRLQKHNLIKANRKALVEIYGQAIFQRGWPVGIKQIKTALGIQEKDHLIESVEGLADLIQATEVSV